MEECVCIPPRDVSAMLKKAILEAVPFANVSVRIARDESFSSKKRGPLDRRDIDVQVKNWRGVGNAGLSKIALICRTHEGIDGFDHRPLRRWIKGGEVAIANGSLENIEVPWKKGIQVSLFPDQPSEVRLLVDKVNLWIGHGSTGPFTDQTDFTWILENYATDEEGYASRIPAKTA
tara:strand:+ start:4561 stop:5088 length:528 start_codon:yes stop_codon:yes gene_type:complete